MEIENSPRSHPRYCTMFNGEVLAVKLVEINPRIAGADKDRVKEMVAALDQEIDTTSPLSAFMPKYTRP
jgi:ubiquinone biosynthesis protein UbiJ